MTFRQMLDRGETVVAPSVWCALTAKLAEAAGAKALYLGGGPLGYLKCITEANITLPEMVDTGLEIRTVCPLPLILDGTCGWGDPMHQHRTIGLAEAAGFAGIEIEDQPVPRRAHHHAGVEELIPLDLMAAKIREAVAARRSRDFVIIGRTNAARCHSVDEAVRRCDAYKQAGADMLFALPKSQDQVELLARRLPPPLMYMTLGGGFESMPFSTEEMGRLGYRLLVDPMSAVLAVHRAMAGTYRAMVAGVGDPLLAGSHEAEHKALNRSIDLEHMLEIERRTVGARTVGH
jgi:2-methylisocitrate lyase-like PEP mutase family enzyme